VTGKHEVGECQNCQYWEFTEGEETGVCAMASDDLEEYVPAADKESDLGNGRQYNPHQGEDRYPFSKAKAWAQGWEWDGAALSTAPEFGCTQWQEGQPKITPKEEEAPDLSRVYGMGFMTMSSGGYMG